ncbi:MAG: PEP-CTERM sorting domain-containing protein [Thermoguttaceae bacterium]|nr:PEP-CTERM sorting domain-containing protein [Thermoguttaceae bacterium]
MKRPININTKRGTFSRLGTALVLGGTMLSCASTLNAGVQLSGLMGRDVTDPVDAITQYFYANDLYKTGMTDLKAGHESAYADAECPASLFDNLVGGGASKWYDSTIPTADAPAFVEVTFPEAFVMTHFTLTSGNDSMGSRNPANWGVYGSNDGGQTWNLIYSADGVDDFVNTTNTTMLYSSFTNDTIGSTVLNSAQQAYVTNALGDKTISTADFTNTTAYSSYRLEIKTTSGEGAAQLGEWEIYGNKTGTVTPKTTPLQTNGNSALNILANRSKYTLDAQDASTITMDADGNVSAWKGVGENGLSFVQTNTALQPNMTTVDINGKMFNALNFVNTTEKVRSEHLICTTSVVDAQTVLILAKNDDNKGLMGIWGQQGDYGIRLNGNGRWQTQGNGSNGGDFTNSGTILYNGEASNVVLQNNVYLTQANRSAYSSMGNNVIGDYFTSTSYGNRGYDGNIMEVMVFDHALCPAENRLVNTYFETKYGMEIAGAVDVIPTDNAEFSKDLLAIMNQPKAEGSADRYLISESGANGIAIGSRDVLAAAASSPFDIFNTWGPASGAEVYAVTNISGETFGTTEITTADGDTMHVWNKQLYLTNNSAEDMADWNVTMAFDMEEAGYEYADKDISDWVLLYRATENDAFMAVDGLDTTAFSDGYLDFTFSSDLLSTGYYALGTSALVNAPEPGTCALLLLGSAGLFLIRRRRK